jgi:hypothetical protein
MVPTFSGASTPSKHTVPIVLGVLGGLVAILLVVLGLLFRARRKAGAAVDPEKVAPAKASTDEEEEEEEDDLDIKKALPTTGDNK